MRHDIFFILVVTVCDLAVRVHGNTPPVLHLDRDWLVQDDDPIGAVVSRVSASDHENDAIHYNVGKPSFGIDASPYFAVDRNGRVRIVKSLKGKGGQTMFLKVIATDSTIPTSAEIRVKVLSSKTSRSGAPDTGLFGALNPAPPPGSFVLPSHVDHRTFIQNTGPVSHDTPPILSLPEGGVWTLPHTSPKGATIATVSAFDVSGDEYFTFSISDKSHLLSIDPHSGDVTVNRALRNQVGDHLVNVTVTNSHGTASGFMILRVTGPPDMKISQPVNNDIIEEQAQPGLIAIVKNGPTAPPFQEDEDDWNSVEMEDEDITTPHFAESKIVVIVVPLLGLTSAIACFTWWCMRSAKKKAAAKENSMVKYDKKGLEVTPVSSTTNTLTPGGPRALPHVRRFWSRRASENSYEENEKSPVVDLPSVEAKDGSDSFVPEPTDEWEFPRHKLKVIGILGEGCFGQVWKYEAQDLDGPGKNFVAVKTLKESAGSQDKRDLQQELKVLKRLGKHPNVVSLLACCTGKEPIFLVLEYMVNGKLQSYLRERRSRSPYNNLHGTSSSLSPRDLTVFALQVAKGMEYLSSHGIVHRDLAARNVLVGDDKICKVADFGFARDIANNHVYERKSDGRLPIRWMAVESLYDNIFTSKTDVWSFGILLWEIVTLGSTPYPGMSAEEVMKRIRGGYRLEKPSYCKREVYNIMYYCWYEDARDRPTFKELIKHLEDLITSEVDYIEINKFPERCYYNVSVSAASGELL